MARIATSGAELGNLATNEAGTTPDGVGNSTTNIAIETVTIRSGAKSWKIAPSTSVATYVTFSFTGATGTDYYARVYILFKQQADVPAVGNKILSISAGGTEYATISVSSSDVTGVILRNPQVGVDAPVSIPYNTWARIEVHVKINAAAGADDTVEASIDGNIFASSTTLNLGTAAPNTVTFGFTVNGFGGAPGTSKIAYFDDFAINDSTGTVQTSWPGEGKVVLLKPTSLNANGGSWTDSAAATTSAALIAGVNNTPPLGIADTTASAGHQDRNAAANTSLDFNMTDYTTAGVAATDRIRVIVPIISTGAPVVTGAKAGSVGVVSNPTIANIAFVNGASAAANFWSGVAAGTYPTGWKWEKGTTTYDPSVTPGTSPVMRVTITSGTTSRVAMVDFMGIYVEYSPKRSLIHNEVRRRNLQKMIGR